ncbi:putative storage protein LPV [Phytophthora cinnamomi]|uniref:putative storage protein LPV n=1 Tax=Phytophthora cinnamomi TaxID=4785 RepID=UPI0035594FAD|nr:putative storage protein LPV [Phytophthora cinnamomi]
MAASLEVPDFVEAMGDPYFPSFDELDQDGDGIVSYTEYMADLNQVWADDRQMIANSALPDVVKEDLNSQLDDKITSDTACVKKAMITSKKRQLTFNRSTIDSLYYMLEVFCFDTPIEVPQKYIDMFPDTQAPVATPAPVAATQAPQSGTTGSQFTNQAAQSGNGNQYNHVDNGDKDFMTKDDFQLQIGTHFAEKIMALKDQARAEDTETDTLLKQQKQLDDCILQASNKFGYYGVYEQAPHFDDAVHWIDNDCLNQ